MSFFDKPIVDESSKISEESVHFITGLFTRKNGFICREELPDYGVDLDIELITESSASGLKFATQIKSSKSLKYLKQSDSISFEFKTSRLGYLCRRKPAYGIIIVYDDNKQKAYFEYVENIIFNLMDIKNSDDWKEQENVNIHIPIKNILNKSSVKTIYDRIKNRYGDLDSLLNKYGNDFNIPILTSEDKSKLNNPEDLLESLEKYGLALIDSFDFKLLHHLIKSISFDKILISNKLLFLASVTYTETGNYIDAKYFIERSLRNSKSYSEQEIVILNFCKAKTDVFLGDMDNISFYKKMNALIETEKQGTQNYLTLKINLLHAKVSFLFNNNSEIEPVSKQELLDLFKEIENASLKPRIMHFLKTYHAENFHGYALKVFIKETGDLKMHEKLGQAYPLEKRISLVKELVELINFSLQYFEEAYNYAKQENDKLLMARSLKAISGHFLSVQYNLLSFNNWKLEDIKRAKPIFQKAFNDSLRAYNLFIELDLANDVHTVLTFAYEIKIMFKLSTGIDLDEISLDKIRSILSEIESNTGIKEFKSILEKNYYNKDKNNIWDIPDGEEILFAKEMLEMFHLPDDRLDNVLIEIKTQKIFHSKCKDDNIQLLQDTRHFRSKETTYASPPRYILRNKKTGIESLPNTDINKLLEQFNIK